MDSIRDPYLSHIPPQNLEAEESILSTILLYNEELFKIDNLKPADFYRSSHGKIFEAITELADAGEAIDLVTVSNALKSKGQLEECGGGSYLAHLTDTVPISPNIAEYANIVKDKATLRETLNACAETIQECFEASEKSEVVINHLSGKLASIEDGNSSKTYCFVKDVLGDAIDEIEFRSQNKSMVSGLATGLHVLDAMTSGFQNSDLIIIAGRPSMGKTAIALNLMQNFCKNQICGAYYSLEMSKKQNTLRLISSESGVNSVRLRTGQVSRDEWICIADAAGSINDWPLIIDDSSSTHYRQIINRSHQLKKKFGIKWVVIDYLQLVRGDRARNDNRNNELGEISNAFKGLAKDLDVPVIVLSQLNREVEKRSPRIPRLSDLRDSGNIEQDADLVIALYRDEYYNTDEMNPNRRIADALILKARNGPTGVVRLQFHKETSTFRNLAEGYGDQSPF
uniref:DNA 5'-3' helicase n=1 Tax=viral metagenome TaxID=1070528 RepID=A0A6H1ZVW5_9ZZZZ